MPCLLLAMPLSLGLVGGYRFPGISAVDEAFRSLSRLCPGDAIASPEPTQNASLRVSWLMPCECGGFVAELIYDISWIFLRRRLVVSLPPKAQVPPIPRDTRWAIGIGLRNGGLLSARWGLRLWPRSPWVYTHTHGCPNVTQHIPWLAPSRQGHKSKGLRPKWGHPLRVLLTAPRPYALSCPIFSCAREREVGNGGTVPNSL